jgi:hypothetical protein
MGFTGIFASITLAIRKELLEISPVGFNNNHASEGQSI